MSEVELENKRRMRQYIDAWNDHDPEAIVAFLSDDNEQYTVAELRTVAETWFAAFPDLTHEIKELAADGDWGPRSSDAARHSSGSVQGGRSDRERNRNCRSLFDPL